jgi:predicted nuclease of predicted toxin-antitoxin system
MRLLADENFPGAIVAALRSTGHDVVWARTDCSGWKDIVLLEFAETQARILLTLDKDFWQIALQRRTPLKQSGVVLFRVHPATPETLGPLVRAFVEAGKIWSGHLTTVTPAGIQMLSARLGSEK